MTEVDLSKKSQLIPFLKKHFLQIRKKWGQNFLVSSKTIDKIIAASLPAKSFLEIGCGPGILTQKLTLYAPTIALDIDERAKHAIKEAAPSAKFIQADILQVDLIKLTTQMPLPITVVSNLPYYITTPILEKLLTIRNNLEKAVLTMQKEVAERISALTNNPDRGAISVIYQWYFDIETVATIPKSCFYPEPNVDSKALLLKTKKNVAEISTEMKELIYAGFSAPRKTLLNNLSKRFNINKEKLTKAFDEIGIKSSVRAHQLHQDDWKNLSDRVHNLLH